MYSFYDLMFLFFIYSIIGWMVEVCYRSVILKKFVNSGFLSGSYCPIYGFGMVTIILLLTPVSENPALLFVGAFVLTSLLEFITGWVLHKLFKTRWWDYTQEKFNIGGYICLRFSIFWGVGACIVMRFVHPLIYNMVGKINHTLGVVILIITTVIFAVDGVQTVLTILKLNKDLDILNGIAAELRETSDKIARHLGNAAIEADEVHDEIVLDLQARRDFVRADIIDVKVKRYYRLLNAFPHMKHDKCNNELEELRKRCFE